jgi:ATP-dependent Lon protease
MAPSLRKRKNASSIIPPSKRIKQNTSSEDEDEEPKDKINSSEESGNESVDNSKDSGEDSGEDSGDESSDDSFIDSELEKLKDINKEAYTNLCAVKEEIANTEPDVTKLLLTPMRLEDRTKLCQYYEIYKMQTPNTNEWLESRTKYNKMFKEYKAGYEQSKKYSAEDIARMKQDEQKFTGFDAQLALKYKILNLKTTKENKEVIYRRYEEFLALDCADDEFNKMKHWLTWATDFPHDRIKEHIIDNITDFIKKAKDHMDRELYGMEKIKEQILLFLSAKMQNPNMINANLGLVGPPGTGKTCIARLISEIMDCGFAQISFGGVDKADFLKGHEYTYVGAQPGEIVKCIKRMGHKNGIIFLDELDKIADNPEIRSALLHLIDPSQNTEYCDNFLGGEIKIDLSKIWYIASMNSPPIDEALTDRWWIINVDGYDRFDKISIIQNYLLPRALKNCGLEPLSASFQLGSAGYLINKVCTTNDKGVRTLEKTIKDIVNKINFIVTHQDKNGTLPFKTSFQMKSKLSFPITLNQQILDKLLEEKELDSSLNMMYI